MILTLILCFIAVIIFTAILVWLILQPFYQRKIYRLKQQLKYSNDAYYQLEQQDRCHRSELIMLKTDKEGSI